jgi:hypothetical protein
VKLVWQLLQMLFAEHLTQFEMLQVTQVPVVLMVRLLLQEEQKLLELQALHCWTLQLTQTVPLLAGFPDEQVEQMLAVLQRVHPETLQATQTPLEAVNKPEH